MAALPAAAADGERGRGRRLLIVNDISCGAIAVQAAAWGWQVTVVSEEAPSDYALCVEKREAGGVSPELAALDCAEMAERAGNELV